MSAAEVLSARTNIILCRYQSALSEIDSPLVASPEAWQSCRTQAETILNECVEALSSGTGIHVDAYIRTRELGVQRALQQVPIADSLRAGTLLWQSAISVLRGGLSADHAACEPQLIAAMEALHYAISLRLYIGVVAYEHASLMYKIVVDPGDHATQPDGAYGQLTLRERQVLEAVAQARSNRAIAQRLGVAETTVKSHLQKIFRKLGATSRVDAILKAGISPAEFD